MSARYLLLNNGITIGVFRVTIPLPTHVKNPSNGVVGLGDQMILILISKNGKYLRIYDNRSLSTKRFSVTSKDCYQNHITDYCPIEYVNQVHLTLSFRNIYVSTHIENLFWSLRLFPEHSINISDQVLKNVSNSRNELNSISWRIAEENRKLFDSDSFQILFYDLHNPDKNYLAICPFRMRLKLVYTMIMKEDDHHLFDYYQQSGWDLRSRTKTTGVHYNSAAIPGYHLYTFLTYIPIYDIASHSLIYDLLNRFFRHYSVEQHEHVLILPREMMKTTDSSSDYGHEMKELVELSPALTSLLNHSLSMGREETLEGKENDLAESFELENHSASEKERFYPLFTTLPFYVTHERFNGFDYHSNQQGDSQQQNNRSEEKTRQLVHWILSLATGNDFEKTAQSFEAVFSVVKNEVWAMPSFTLRCDDYLTISAAGKENRLASLVILRNEFFYLSLLLSSSLITNGGTTVQQYSLHSNFLAHLFLSNSQQSLHSRPTEHPSSSQVVALPENRFTAFQRFTFVLRKLLSYQSYVQTNIEQLQYYYLKYVAKHAINYRKNNKKDEENQSKKEYSPFASLPILNDEDDFSMSSNTVNTEEFLYRDVKYIFSFSPRMISHDNGFQQEEDIGKNVHHIHSNYFRELLMIKMNVDKGLFTVLLPNAKEILLTVEEYQQKENFFFSLFDGSNNNNDGPSDSSSSPINTIEDIQKKIQALMFFLSWISLSKNEQHQRTMQRQSLLQRIQQTQSQNRCYWKMQNIIRDVNDPLSKYFSKAERKATRSAAKFSFLKEKSEVDGDDIEIDNEQELESPEEDESDNDEDGDNDSVFSGCYDPELVERHRKAKEQERQKAMTEDDDEDDEDWEEILNSTYIPRYQAPLPTPSVSIADRQEGKEENDENSDDEICSHLKTPELSKNNIPYKTKNSIPSSKGYLQLNEPQYQDDEGNAKNSLRNRAKEMHYEGNRIREKNKSFLELMKQYDE
jgi:hypothetical protein